MINRRLLLAAVTGTTILAAVASHALPVHTPGFGGVTRDIVKTDYREHEGKSQNEGHRRHSDENGRYAANDCDQYGEAVDDDEGVDACRSDRAPIRKDANPPSNGLFTPGSTPRSQMN
ncbi:hypothetical protein Rleg10DRAFT_3686 [Rhizobium leguminosarum bv. trifolii WSM2012]|nr:hypothetical protein Rleg10DRAFT_3686 [Rhizobium leguminosarum bv. trifolii WSM2012]